MNENCKYLALKTMYHIKIRSAMDSNRNQQSLNNNNLEINNPWQHIFFRNAWKSYHFLTYHYLSFVSVKDLF